MPARPALGIDLGGTNCRGALVWPDGRCEGWRQQATPRTADAAELLAFLDAFCGSFGIRAGGFDISGVGCGVPAPVAPSGLIGTAPNLPALTGLPLERSLRERLNLPVRVVNDANAAAWGEAEFGAGRDLDSFLLVTLGTGIGGGIVLGRALWSGSCGAAGEIGHLPIFADGRRCGCGSCGCLETYASMTGIRRTVLDGLESGSRSILNGSDITGETVANAARAGDVLACHAYALAGTALGQGLAGAVNLLNPDALIFTGGGAAAFDLLRPPLERELRQRCGASSFQHLQLRVAQLSGAAGVIGAARLAGEAH